MSAISSPAPIPRGGGCEIRPCVAELDHTHSGCMSSEAAEDPHRPKEAEYYDVGNSSQDLAQRAGAVESSVPNGEHHDVRKSVKRRRKTSYSSTSSRSPARAALLSQFRRRGQMRPRRRRLQRIRTTGALPGPRWVLTAR